MNDLGKKDNYILRSEYTNDDDNEDRCKMRGAGNRQRVNPGMQIRPHFTQTRLERLRPHAPHNTEMAIVVIKHNWRRSIDTANG